MARPTGERERTVCGSEAGLSGMVWSSDSGQGRLSDTGRARGYTSALLSSRLALPGLSPPPTVPPPAGDDRFAAVATYRPLIWPWTVNVYQHYIPSFVVITTICFPFPSDSILLQLLINYKPTVLSRVVCYSENSAWTPLCTEWKRVEDRL